MLKFSIEYPKIGICYVSHKGQGLDTLAFEGEDNFLLDWLKGDLKKTYRLRGYSYSEACYPEDLLSYVGQLPKMWKATLIEDGFVIDEPDLPDGAIP